MAVFDKLIEIYGHDFQYEIESLFEKNAFLYEAVFIKRAYEDDLAHMPFPVSYNQEAYCFTILQVKNKSKGERLYLVAKLHTEFYHHSKTRILFKRYYPDGKVPSRKSYTKRGKYELAKSSGLPRSCQITTLAKVTASDPSWVLEQMKLRGWLPKNKYVGNLHTKGFKKSRWDEILELKGKQKITVWKKPQFFSTTFKPQTKTDLDEKEGCTVKTAAKYLTEGTFVVSVRGHVLSIVDGVVYDTWNSTAKHVIEIYKIIDNEILDAAMNDYETLYNDYVTNL